MKKTLMMGALLMGLAACGGKGGGEKAALLKSCVADGESEKTCSCIVDSMEENLSPALFTKVAKASAEEGKNPEDLLGELSAEEQGEFMTLIPAMMTCAMDETGAASE